MEGENKNSGYRVGFVNLLFEAGIKIKMRNEIPRK